MSLIGNTNDEKIWNYFIQKDKIFNKYGVAGLMGNIKIESNFNPKNMQNSYEKKLGFTDETYVEAVDNNTYHGFQTDKCGFGLCQHTSSGRKTNMWIYSKETNRSIGDLEFQLDFIMWELNNGYKTVLNILKNATSVKEASDCVCTKYERPADQSITALKKRSDAGEETYKKFISKETTGTNGGKLNKMGYSNSSLVNYVRISPNKTSPRNHKIDCITIHHMAGNLSIEACGEGFAKPTRKGSSNYAVGTDGRIGMYVEEKDRSWCSSNKANDHRAITIEVANDGGAKTNWHVSDKALESLIKLVADICKRNDIKKLIWSENKSDRVNHRNGCNMTVHRDFASTACPGSYLYSKMPYIADEVNKVLSGSQPAQPIQPVNISINQFTPLKGDPNHFAEIIKNIKMALNIDYGLHFVIDSSINDILLINLGNVVLSTSSYKNNITYALQQLLKWWGYDIVIDGLYGNGTKSIVSLFQSQIGIANTGTTTKEFWYKVLGK